MSLADIKALPVADWAAPDCVLLLWTTDPFLEKAFEVIHAWGFKYKTVGFYWTKVTTDRPDSFNPCVDITGYPIGTGYWTRCNPEQCLLATRGRPKRINADVRKLVIAPRREHSRKPDEVYERIERLCPGPYLELFARTLRHGWSSWGQEAGQTGFSPRRWASRGHPE